VISGRLAGAFRNVGRDRIADDILNTMKRYGYVAREHDPFETRIISFTGRETSPYVNRLSVMWQQMRNVIIEHFPKPFGLPENHEAFLKKV
jgi:hypothetical protein